MFVIIIPFLRLRILQILPKLFLDRQTLIMAASERWWDQLFCAISTVSSLWGQSSEDGGEVSWNSSELFLILCFRLVFRFSRQWVILTFHWLSVSCFEHPQVADNVFSLPSYMYPFVSHELNHIENSFPPWQRSWWLLKVASKWNNTLFFVNRYWLNWVYVEGQRCPTLYGLPVSCSF